MIIDRIKDQYSSVLGFAAHSPLMEKVDCVALDIRTIERMNRHYRDLGMSLLFDLVADVIHLRDRVLIQNVSEVVDVVGGLELGNRLGLHGQSQQQRTGHTEPPFCA